MVYYELKEDGVEPRYGFCTVSINVLGKPSQSLTACKEDMAGGGGRGVSGGGVGGQLKEGGQQLVGVEDGGIERVAEKLWARVWVSSFSSWKGRARSGSL